MNITKSLKIQGFGKYLPSEVESNELEKSLGIPAGWSAKYSGVSRRHHATFETNGYMGARALEDAINNSKLELKDIDLLISAGGTYDYPLPNQACIIKNELKKGNSWNAPAIDIDSTCLSFVTALDIASNMLSERYKTIAIVSSEIASKGLNPNNSETKTLFGDAAVACIVSKDPSGKSGIWKAQQETFSEGALLTLIEGGGNARPFKDYPYDHQMHSFKMEGRKLLRLTKKKLPSFIKTFFQNTETDFLEMDAIIPHQASKFGLEMIKKMYSFKEGQFLESINEYGNCIAASIPLTLMLNIENGRIQRGDICFLVGTSAGYSIGGLIFTY